MYQDNSKDLLNDLNNRNIIPVNNSGRFANLIIDTIVLMIIQQGIGQITGLITPAPSDFKDLNQVLIQTFLFSYSINFLYYFICESTSSATVGKLITGTRVIREDGFACSNRDIAIRNLCRLIPFNGLSFLFNTPSGWHDTLSKTRVIKKEDWDRNFNLK